ncbi:MAG: hypothetical protein KDJ77_05660 [Rhodobiaceae bacterium]|nr:hypothetical protein [Rhodobiaceae bacterium]
MSSFTDPTDEIVVLYGSFLSAWNSRDFEGVANCFAEPAFYALPGTDIPVPDRSSFVALLEKVFAGLEADGFSHTEIGEVSARACGETMAIVDAKEVARVRKDGSLIEVIDGHYVVRKFDDGWRFTMAVTCTRGWQG